MVEGFRAASEVSATAQSAPLHDESGCRVTPEKRGAMFADA
jgi:hypothetical protein